MQILSRIIVATFLIVGSVSCTTLRSNESGTDSSKRPENVIFFIADGCGVASYGLAREYQKSMGGPQNLFIDQFLKGSVETFASDHKITDSAASGTAFSCAIKTYNGAIGVDPNGQSVETVLEAAEKAGYQTALISTARITHATPAAFSSHVPNRNMEAEIASQQITKGIEILMGGGASYYLPTEKGGLRVDGKDLIEASKSAGYSIISNRDELMEATSLPILALFTSSHMAYEIDRDPSQEPSLAEMTEKALSLLSGSDKPFFIMIEAGRIDHAGHGNDVAAHLHDVLAYDEAMKVAVTFAQRDKETLVMATSDHETGGLTLGAQWGSLSGYGYDPARIAHVNSSIELFQSEARATSTLSNEDAYSWLSTETESRFGFRSEEFRTELRKMTQYREVVGDSEALRDLQAMLADSTARLARVGWSTGGHTSVDVPVYAFGPGSDLFKATMDNTEVGKAVFEALGLTPRSRK